MVVGFIFVDNTDDSIDTFAGHSSAVTHHSYDRVNNQLNQETQSRRDRYMSREWWCILGLTNKPPPKPRLTSYETAPVNVDNSMLGETVKLMQKQLDDVAKMVQANNTMLSTLMSALSNIHPHSTPSAVIPASSHLPETAADQSSPLPSSEHLFTDGDFTLYDEDFTPTSPTSPSPSFIELSPTIERESIRPVCPRDAAALEKFAVSKKSYFYSPSPKRTHRDRSLSLISQRPVPETPISSPLGPGSSNVNIKELNMHALSAFQSTSTPTKPSLAHVPAQSAFTSTVSIKDKAIIRLKFKQLYQDPLAREKSDEQMEAISDILHAAGDLIVVLPTGGGKSAMWNVIALLYPDETILVICPYRAILDQQLAISKSLGIQAAHFQMSHTTDLSNPDHHVAILFCVPESYANKENIET